jgi:uncharacterized membrane protein HdeD (DUF308 family)
MLAPVLGSGGRGSEESTREDRTRKERTRMIVLGVILLILGAVLDIGILYTVGAILLVVGVVLWILGAIGRPVFGRARYY